MFRSKIVIHVGNQLRIINPAGVRQFDFRPSQAFSAVKFTDCPFIRFLKSRFVESNDSLSSDRPNDAEDGQYGNDLNECETIVVGCERSMESAFSHIYSVERYLPLWAFATQGAVHSEG